jgi:hypothetical protein
MSWLYLNACCNQFSRRMMLALEAFSTLASSGAADIKMPYLIDPWRLLNHAQFKSCTLFHVYVTSLQEEKTIFQLAVLHA